MTDEPIWHPRRVFRSNQVTIPASVLRRAGIGPGDLVYVGSGEEPRRIIIVSKSLQDRRLRR